MGDSTGMGKKIEGAMPRSGTGTCQFQHVLSSFLLRNDEAWKCCSEEEGGCEDYLRCPGSGILHH